MAEALVTVEPGPVDLARRQKPATTQRPPGPGTPTLCRRAQAWRAGGDVTFTTLDGLEAAELVDAVVRDAVAGAGRNGARA